MNLLLIGAQGSGKGTQAEQLARTLAVSHISSGDLFRKNLDKKTALSARIKAYLDRGELVPDEITTAMVLEQIAQSDSLAGILLDGFPRTVAQARILDVGLERIGQHIDQAIYLEVPRSQLLKRLSSRYICRARQHIYNTQSRPPKHPGICDVDGSELYQRSDDTGEAVQKRLAIFFDETIHLLDYYGKQQKLVNVNGDQDIDKVYLDLLAAINPPALHVSGSESVINL